MSVLGLKSGYTVKYGLSPSRFPSGLGHILLYTPPLVQKRIQYEHCFCSIHIIIIVASFPFQRKVIICTQVLI